MTAIIAIRGRRFRSHPLPYRHHRRQTAYYLFDGLPQGRFHVQVAPSNFVAGGALENYRSSTGS